MSKGKTLGRGEVVIVQVSGTHSLTLNSWKKSSSKPPEIEQPRKLLFELS